MIRKIAIVTALFGLALTLAACDKCGGFEEIRVPGVPHACKDANTR
jgi:hypothetical protein